MGTKKYKLRTSFEDFYVDEQLDYNLTDNGAYSLFKLEKWGLDTLGALRITSKKIKVPRKRIGYSGLKDRYSYSCQYITVPKAELKRKKIPADLEFSGKSIKLKYVGEVEKQLRLGTHRSNFFRITIRRMTAESLDMLVNNLNTIGNANSIPNYFDSQKFGFLGGPDNFFAAQFLKRNYENALKLVIAKPNRKERPRSKIVHKFIQENWGNWSLCSGFLEEHNFENYLKLTTYLENNPCDFLGTIKLLTKDILKLKITAFQAFLWNEYIKSILKNKLQNADLIHVKYHVGTLIFLSNPGEMNIPSSEVEQTIPLPSFNLNDPYYSDYNSLLQHHFGLKNIIDFEKFSELRYITNAHRRSVFVRPENLIMEDSGRDKNLKKEKNRYCTLSFELPPGAYATVLIKALLLA